MQISNRFKKLKRFEYALFLRTVTMFAILKKWSQYRGLRLWS